MTTFPAAPGREIQKNNSSSININHNRAVALHQLYLIHFNSLFKQTEQSRNKRSCGSMISLIIIETVKLNILSLANPLPLS